MLLHERGTRSIGSQGFAGARWTRRFFLIGVKSEGKVKGESPFPGESRRFLSGRPRPVREHDLVFNMPQDEWPCIVGVALKDCSCACDALSRLYEPVAPCMP